MSFSQFGLAYIRLAPGARPTLEERLRVRFFDYLSFQREVSISIRIERLVQCKSYRSAFPASGPTKMDRGKRRLEDVDSEAGHVVVEERPRDLELSRKRQRLVTHK